VKRDEEANVPTGVHKAAGLNKGGRDRSPTVKELLGCDIRRVSARKIRSSNVGGKLR